MATGKVTHWCRNGKTFAAEEGDVPFSLSDADDVWGHKKDPNQFYNPATPTEEEEKEDELDERRLKFIDLVITTTTIALPLQV